MDADMERHIPVLKPFFYQEITFYNKITEKAANLYYENIQIVEFYIKFPTFEYIIPCQIHFCIFIRFRNGKNTSEDIHAVVISVNNFLFSG